MRWQNQGRHNATRRRLPQDLSFVSFNWHLERWLVRQRDRRERQRSRSSNDLGGRGEEERGEGRGEGRKKSARRRDCAWDDADGVRLRGGGGLSSRFSAHVPIPGEEQEGRDDAECRDQGEVVEVCGVWIGRGLRGLL